MDTFIWNASMSKKFFRCSYLFLLSFLVFVTAIFAGMEEELFLKAQTLYEQEKFEDALLIYRNLSKKSSAVWENRGNAAFYVQEYPEAIFCWRQVQLHAHRGKYLVLEERINQALQKVQCEQYVPWYEKSIVAFAGYMNYCSLFFWQSIVLLCWVLLLFFGQLFSVRRKRIVLLLLLSITGIAALGLGASYWQSTRRIGIVMQDGALHTGMNAQFPVAVHVKPGQQVRVISQDSDWYCVQAGQHRGWIEKHKLEYRER